MNERTDEDGRPPDSIGVQGDPIPEVFNPDEPTARFVVSMAMASNDLDRAFLDLIRSHAEDGQDFTYRVRLSIGHLVEAIDALNAYSRACPDVRNLLARMPDDGQQDLKRVRGTLQKAGSRFLQGVRDNTFHYPSPNTAYTPTSDEQLQDALRDLGDRGAELHLDGDTNAVMFTFADDAAIRLAVGAVTQEELLERFEIARDGALAFSRWAKALVMTYRELSDLSFGEPAITPKRKAGDGT